MRFSAWWSAAILASFAVGCGTIIVFPSTTARVVDIGTALNEAMAVAVGAYFGWSRRCSFLFAVSVVGTVVTAIGCVALSVVTPFNFEGDTFSWGQTPLTPANLAGGTLEFVVEGIVDMSLLLAAGAVVGSLARLAGRGCLMARHRRRPPNGTKPAASAGTFRRSGLVPCPQQTSPIMGCDIRSAAAGGLSGVIGPKGL